MLEEKNGKKTLFQNFFKKIYVENKAKRGKCPRKTKKNFHR